MLIRKLLFRDPAPTDGGSGTVVSSPDVVTIPPTSEPVPSQPIVRTSRVDMPKPVPEDIKKQTFSIDDFDVEQLPPHTETPKDESTPKETPKDTEKTKAPAKEEKKPDEGVQEVKKEPTPDIPKFLKPPGQAKTSVEDVKAKEVIKPIAPPSSKVVRDYSGHSDEEVAAFKKMSDEAYAFTKRVLDERKNLERSTYLQHENAYLLDPEFRKVQEDMSFISKEAQHWAQQLELCKEGKPIKEAIGFNADGSIKTAPERNPTAQDEENLRLAVMNCHNAISQLSSKAQQYPQTYKQQVQRDLQGIQQERLARFAWQADPKIQDYTLHIDGIGDRSIKQVREDFMSIVPAYMRGHPGFEVSADLMVALRIAQAEIAELQNGKAVEQILQEESSKVEPSSTQKPQLETATAWGVKEFKDDLVMP